MQKVTYRDRFQYWFDNMMARGAPALIGLLALVAGVVILIITVLVAVAGIVPAADSGPPDFFSTLWADLNLTLGTDAATSGEWTFELSTFVLALAGLFVVGSLVGILTTGLDSRLEELR